MDKLELTEFSNNFTFIVYKCNIVQLFTCPNGTLMYISYAPAKVVSICKDIYVKTLQHDKQKQEI